MENSEIAAKMSEALSKSGGIDKSVKFDFGGEGAVWAQGTEAKVSDDEADCTINVDKADFLALANGEMDPMMAFMSGKLKVAGDMSVAMGLQSVFSNM
ncbi:SCP2 sterol-binding domain-containing protein [Litorimonas sp. RW-G-Af-16]|uniref:SCP2 sterol-binding domain-containing protein n=1 Tax=Litorimonas sp. RW-G-Af-16 TaxID=3241168 RepID=UPI00390CC565